MNIVDAHQHFWKYDPVHYSWISDDMQVIRKDFLPNHLAEVFAQNKVGACVAVQADQTENETDWLLQLAAENNFIAGVVGWLDLRHPQVEERLHHYAQFAKLKGFRHVLQGEDPTFMLQPEFLNGISLLHKFGFTYDLLIFPKHLDAALQLVQQFPEQPFVIDHIAKPLIKEGKIDEWKNGMQKLAEHENVMCKISGMVTEADWQNWTEAQLHPYIDLVVNCFGTRRIMFGSDWPVCLVASSYQQWLLVCQQYFSPFSSEEQLQFFGGNAIDFYSLNS